MGTRNLSILALSGVPMVTEGQDLARLATDAMARDGISPADGDILVFCHKIVSKAEGRVVRLADVQVSEDARILAEETGKPPEICELILQESRALIRQRRGVVIAEHRLGHIVANAAIDQSNVSEEGGAALMLPLDPDASACALREELEARTGKRIGVIISDSFGRAWRLGTLGAAIGLSGPPVLNDQRGQRDLTGRTMQTTMPAIADALAAAAVLVMGEANEGTPIALIRGWDWTPSADRAADILRPASEDMFR